MEAWIPKSNLGKFESKMARLIKKAEKLKMPAPTYRVTEDVEVRKVCVSKNDDYANVTHIRVEVEGEFPKLPGWNLIAVLIHQRYVDHSDESTFNRVDAVPGNDIGKSFRTATPDCDHCKSNRYRKVTYILENDKGTYRKQVGSSCVEDFLGGKSPEYIMNQAAYITFFNKIFNDEELLCVGGSYEQEWPLVDILTYTSMIIEHHGWLSRSKSEDYGGMPTSEYIWDRFIGDGQLSRGIHRRPVNESDRKMAEDAIAWMADNDLKTVDSEYIYNAALISKSGWITTKEFGLAVSIIGTYQNHVRRELERERKANLPPGRHVGEVGERLKFEGVKFIWEYVGNSSWGIYTIMKFLTRNNELIIWKTGPQDVEVGQIVNLTGTVKLHSEYNGEKQTTLTRCKMEVA